MSGAVRDRIFPFELKKTGAKTVLVAGGAGFVGSYLCEQLISQDFQVICVDNLTSGSKENIKSLLNRDDFTFIKADLNAPNFRFPEDLRLETIIHAAGLEEFSIDKDLSLETLLVNSLGTRVLLELAKVKNAKFIFVSSADLYSGAFSSTSLRYYFGKDSSSESAFTHNEAKRFAEALVFEYFKNYDLFAVVVRIKDVYGPRMDLRAEGETNTLVKDAVSGKKLAIAGDGLKTINPTYVTDVSAGIIKAALLGSKGEIYNLVNPEKITINAFAQAIRHVIGNTEITYKKEKEDLEPPYHQLDFSTSQEKLDWRPSISLAEGISQTVAFFRRPKQDPVRATQPIFSNDRAEKPRRFGILKKLHLKHLRFIIFLAALSLVVIAVLYPGASLVFNTYQANSDFKVAIASLEGDRVLAASNKAQSAENSYKKAAQDLQNLNWFTQIIVDRRRLNALEDFYYIGEEFSGATYYTALALEILIDQAAEKGKLDSEALQLHIKNISNLAASAKSRYELGVASLDALNESEVPKALRDNLEETTKAGNLLREIIEELPSSTGS